jgi:hypothetical protein
VALALAYLVKVMQADYLMETGVLTVVEVAVAERVVLVEIILHLPEVVAVLV